MASTSRISLSRLLGAAKYLLALLLLGGGITGLVAVVQGLNAHDLTATLDRVDLVSKMLTSAAIVVGGIWALFTFDLLRTGVPSVQLAIEPKVVELASRRALVLLSIGMKNVGRVSARAGRHGCRLSVYASGLEDEVGPIDCPEQLVMEQELFGHYGPDRRVYLDPGAELHEACVLATPPGTLLLVRVDFYIAGVSGAIVTESRHVAVMPAVGAEDEAGAALAV